MKWYVVLILFCTQFVVVVVAGVIIHYLEVDNEFQQSTASINEINAFQKSKPCLNNKDMKTLYDSLREFKKSGLSFREEEYGTAWDFQSSFYASMQILSSVGFGASSPKTPGGRVFLVFYAVFGLSIFFVVAFGLGEQMLKVSDFVRRRVWFTATNRDSWKVFLIRTIMLVIAGFIIFSVIFGGIFCAIDPTLNYGQTLSIISIVFLGPGAFIPGGNNPTMFKSWYRLLVGIWTICSVLWFAGIYSTIRRTIVEYHDQIETPDTIQNTSIATSPLTSVVDVSSGIGQNKTTEIYSYHRNQFKPEVTSGYINSINVG